MAVCSWEDCTQRRPALGPGSAGSALGTPECMLCPPRPVLSRVQAMSTHLTAGPEAGPGGAEAGRGFTFSETLGEAGAKVLLCSGPRMARPGGALDVGVSRPGSEPGGHGGRPHLRCPGLPPAGPAGPVQPLPAGEGEAGACPRGSQPPPPPFPLPLPPHQNDRRTILTSTEGGQAGPSSGRREE